MQNIRITRRLSGDNTVIHLKWGSDVSLSGWTDALTIEWRKYAAIIPETFKRARSTMREAGLRTKDLATPQWFIPEDDLDDPPRVTAFFSVATEDEPAALKIIRTALIDTIGLFEAPHVPRPGPEYDAADLYG